jgi:hypothetical protein
MRFDAADGLSDADDGRAFRTVAVGRVVGSTLKRVSHSTRHFRRPYRLYQYAQYVPVHPSVTTLNGPASVLFQALSRDMLPLQFRIYAR